MPTAPSELEERGRPATEAGGTMGAYWLAASAMSSTSSTIIRTPGAAWNEVWRGSGLDRADAGEGRAQHGLRVGVVGVEREHQSGVGIGPQVDVVDARARVAGLQPQTRCVVPGDPPGREPGDVVGSASVSARRASAGGSRSASRGSRIDGSRLVCASSRS